MNFESHKESPWLHLTPDYKKLKFLTSWKMEKWQQMINFHYIDKFWFVKCHWQFCTLCQREKPTHKAIVVAAYDYDLDEIKLFRISYALYNKLYTSLSEKTDELKYFIDKWNDANWTRYKRPKFTNWITTPDYYIRKFEFDWKTHYEVEIATEKNRRLNDFDDDYLEEYITKWEQLIKDKLEKINKDEEIILRWLHIIWKNKIWNAQYEQLKKIEQYSKIIEANPEEILEKAKDSFELDLFD